MSPEDRKMTAAGLSVALLLIVLPVTLAIWADKVDSNPQEIQRRLERNTEVARSVLSRLYPGVDFRIVCGDNYPARCIAARDNHDPIALVCNIRRGECHLQSHSGD